MREKGTRDPIITIEEVKDMIENGSPEVGSLVAFLYLSGCRITEALMMRKDDIWEDEDGRIIFRINVLKSKSIGKHTIKVSKFAPFMDIVLEWNSKRNPGERVWVLSSNMNSARVIAHRQIKRLNNRVYPHLFRHTRLTRLAEKGATPLQLQIWAGWKSISPADVYVRRSTKMVESLADKVD